MTLNEFIDTLPKNWWVDDLINKSKLNLIPVFSSKEKKHILDEFHNSLVNGRRGKAISWLTLSIIVNYQESFKEIKTKGYFRYSKYVKTNNLIKDIAKCILKNSKNLNVSEKDVTYLNSIVNMGFLHKTYINIEHNIKKTFEIREKLSPQTSILKELLVYADYLFLNNYLPTYEGGLSNFSKEGICEGISFLLYLYNEQFGFNKKPHILIDESFFFSEEMNLLLLSACTYKKLQELELLIDLFGYKCYLIEGKIIFEPYNAEIEKGALLGFIRTNYQRYYLQLSQKEEEKSFVSLKQLAEMFYEETGDQFFQLKEDFGFKRYVLNTPEPILELLYSNENIFYEERQYLSVVFKEQFLNFAKLEKIEIKPGISIMDIVRLKRIFSIIYYLFSEKIQKEAENNKELIIRSLLPTSNKQRFVELLNRVSKKKSELLLEMMTWDSSNEVLDLQYHPFLLVNNYYFMPFSIIHHSDTIRNIFASENKRGNKDIQNNGDFDPLTEMLIHTFKKAGYETRDSIRFTYNNKRSDIDFLAFKEKDLFIVECINAIYPGSIYEVRTSYDYIIKANDQLNLSKIALLDNNFREQLGKRLHIDLRNVNNLYTCIVTGNRLFTGINIFDHPVRYIYELINLVISGQIQIENDFYSMWINDDFSFQDLIEYLDDNDGMLRYYYNS